MSRLLSSILTLRRDPRLLRLPPYLSFLCIVVGVAWLFLLPLDDHSRRTYISENALLPGQVHTYFGGSDNHIFRAYRHELSEVENAGNILINDKLESILKGIGLKVARQNFTYDAAGERHAGQNLYGILQAPRGDATESIVLIASWRTIRGDFNRNGVALALALARYFRRWSLWSKDIIVLMPPDSLTGTQAWVDAYHNAHEPSRVAALPIKSGLLQGAIALDYDAGDRRFESVHLLYDGVNGQLPNLDLINSIHNIAGNQMTITSSIQKMHGHSGRYGDSLQTMLRGMLNQGLGHATGPHSSFMPYHVDAVTVQAHGEGWYDEMALGRLIEASFRSLNNLLEHLHQSFFFYLLVKNNRFVSIGTYLPSAMLVASNFTIIAIFMWAKSGGNYSRPSSNAHPLRFEGKQAGGGPDPNNNETPSQPPERDLFLPLGLVACCQALGAVPLYLFNYTPARMLLTAYSCFIALSSLFPHVVAHVLATQFRPTLQQYQLVKCFSLLLLGMFLSTLATMNFSLAFLVGVLAAPLSFAPTSPDNSVIRWSWVAMLNLVAPTTILCAACTYWDLAVGDVLREAAFGWNIWGLYTPVIVWCVWWPAWMATYIHVVGQTTNQEGRVSRSV